MRNSVLTTDGQTDRHSTSARVELRFAAKNCDNSLHQSTELSNWVNCKIPHSHCKRLDFHNIPQNPFIQYRQQKDYDPHLLFLSHKVLKSFQTIIKRWIFGFY